MVCLSHCPNPSPPDFSKMAVIGEGGEWEISTRNGVGVGGGGVYNGGLEIFKVPWHNWQRGDNLHNNPRPHFFLLSCFFGWTGDHNTFDVPLYLMIIWIYKCWTLRP